MGAKIRNSKPYFRAPFAAVVTVALSALGAPQAAAQDAPSAVADNFTPPSPGPAHRPADYPRIPRMLSQEGIALLKVCVAMNGAITELGLASSSGHDLLDRAARNYLEEVTYRAARRDDMPVDYCRNEVVVLELPEENAGLQPVPDNRITLADYPPDSVSNNEEGQVIVNICVAPDGRIDEVRLVQSSGYPRLDNATIVQVTANLGYSPAMQGDTPVRACFDQPINWGLR